MTRRPRGITHGRRRRSLQTSGPTRLRSRPSARVALVGDFRLDVLAHAVIPPALSLAGAATGVGIAWEWVSTKSLGHDAAGELRDFTAIWCVPGSPYVSARGAIAAIRFARETGRAFLGTCGGFQHAMLEYAEAVWHLPAPAHAELDPTAPDPVIIRLYCALVEVAAQVTFTPGSLLASVYGANSAVESYHCRYGLSPRIASRMERGALRATCRDAAGDVRGIELATHPFFVATLYQPERASLTGRSHPLIEAFVRAAAR